MRYALLTVLVAFVIDLLTLPSKSSLDKDLEILALRHQLRLLQRRRTSRLHCSRFEKLVLAELAFKLKLLQNWVVVTFGLMLFWLSIRHAKNELFFPSTEGLKAVFPLNAIRSSVNGLPLPKLKKILASKAVR